MDALAKVGIDLWSVLLYLVNTGLLVGILTYLLYKPVIKFLDTRRESIKSSLDEAEELKRVFEARTVEMQVAEKEMRETFEKELAQGRQYIAEMKATLATEMQAEKEKVMTQAMTDIAEEKARLFATVRSEVLETMGKVLVTVLGSRMPQDVVEKSIEEEWDRFTSSQDLA